MKFRKDLNIVFRSSWEANFARILNCLNIKWEYEKESFQLKDGYYFPDFFLPNNVIVEIKGFWDSESRTKVNSFIEMHKDYKLYTIDADMLISLERLFKQHIEEWEDEKITVTKEVLPVVGITLSQRKTFVSVLQTGDKLYLKRDPENPYDRNAIQVLNKDGKQIGFIAKEWASIYASKLDIGMTFAVTIRSKEEKVIRVNVERENIHENKIYDFLSNSYAI
ncbi:HIRAN domain-containing protein [Metabacillus rhizolycopersici]|uniref:HIRAN domain-containing protein n=1 Tax=Metabacillus rhizolycopersici TaxID=2875709 RepID=A0ABS7UZG7_9BACI|nr:HIRAN domain-containing protein [Metabacillus rhizolycopersici]MBZ5753728.1 HIRAN domain-containing protein [Metabacillus rhizolycopersici]